MKRILSVFLMALLASATIFAQSSGGRLIGTVAGPDGLVPGASVEIKDNATGKVITATANDEGGFTIPFIDVGTYTVTVKAQGFKTYSNTNVKIDIGREISVDIKLELGTVEETVTVTTGGDIVNTSNAEISTTVSQKEILELPLNGRNPLSLVALQPGNNNAGLSGARSSSTNYTRDGINVQDIFIRNGFVADTPTTDNTSEFTVATANTGAESGFGSSQVQISTPRGGREYHGALFAYNRNSKFAANRFFSNKQGQYLPTDAAVINGLAKAGEDRQARPFLNRNQFGGKFSGPLPLPYFGEGTPVLLKNKAFFFFSIEKFELRQQVSKTTTVLRDSAKQGIFAYRPIGTPAAGQCITFTGGVCTVNVLTGAGMTGAIPAASASSLGVLAVDPTIQSRLISKLPNGTRNDIGDGLNTIGYAFNQSDPENRREYTFRVDGEINRDNTLNFVYRYNRTEDARTDIDGTFSPVALSNTNAPVKFFRTGWITNQGSLTNEVSFGFQKADVVFLNTNLPTGTPLIGGIPLITSPENNFRDQGRNTAFYTIKDQGSYVWGNHVFRFGGEYQKYIVDAFNDAGVNIPTFSITNTGNPNTPFLSGTLYPGSISGGDQGNAEALRYLLGGILGSGSATANATTRTSGFVPGAKLDRQLRYSTMAFFLTDQWRVRPNLTLNLGLRYERYSPLYAPKGLYLEPVLGSDPVASVLNPTGTIDFVGRNSGSEGNFTKADNNNFGPSVGVAYSFGGPGFLKYIFGGENQSTVRGGFSIKYVNDEYFRSQENALLNNSGLTSTAVAVQNNSTQLNARFGALPSLATPTYVQPPFGFSNYTALRPFANGSLASFFGILPDLQVPHQYDYSFSYIRQIGRNTAVQISYIGTQSSEQVRSYDYGQVDITKNGFGADYARAFNIFKSTGSLACLSTANNCPGITVLNQLPLAMRNFVVSNIRFGAPADNAVTAIANGLTGTIPFLANPAFSPVNLLTNDGLYRYNSMQIEVRRRLSAGLLFNANYTFQKILTDSQDDGVSQTRVQPFLDNNQPNLNYSRPAFDLTHTFNFTGLYDLPFGKGRKFLNDNKILDFFVGGWTLGNIVQIFTNPPLIFLDSNGTLNRNGRSGIQTASSPLTKDQIKNLLGIREVNGIFYYIDPSVINVSGRAADGLLNTNGTAVAFTGTGTQAFFLNQPNTTGNIERYAFNGPVYWNWDASLQKSFRISEGMRVVVRGEAFNVTNSTRFTSPGNVNVSSTTFGRITGTYNPRVMQFGARFEF